MCVDKLKQAADYVSGKLNTKGYNPKIGIILGSGLGSFADTVEYGISINYRDIPHFPVSGVEGHAGKFIIGKDVCCMSGRFHYYEGFSMNDVVMGVRTMKLIGIDKLIVTNAAGGINMSFAPGDLMLINSHINLMGNNPLIGTNDERFGTRFPDMSEAYSKSLMDIAFDCAKKLNIDLKSGIYAAVTGPSYETPAEIKAFRILGADAVGMSTVPEVIAAAHCNMSVLGISCITNMAAGILDTKLSHDDVMETSARVKNSFIKLLSEIVNFIK